MNDAGAEAELLLKAARGDESAFLLLYGNPVPGFQAPADQPVLGVAGRIAFPFREVVFDGWTPDQLASIPVQPGAEPILGFQHEGFIGLPPGAMALFYELRARVHGLVMLELTGHLAPLDGFADALFHGMISRTAEELERLRSTRPGRQRT